MRIDSTALLHSVFIEEISSRDHYGRLVCGPLKSGQGVTVGNMFRRFLLGDLQGVAITAAKIHGVESEFSTLVGIRESVLEIFLNLRDLVFFNSFPDTLSPSGFITITALPNEEKSWKPWILRAGDLKLPPGIICVDSTQPIATIVSPMAELNLRFVLEQGHGYRTWKKTSGITQPTLHLETPKGIPEINETGYFFPIDAIFMPIKQVNFTIHERENEGEYVYFEIWTNGSIHPVAAFEEAALVCASLAKACVMPELIVSEILESGVALDSDGSINEVIVGQRVNIIPSYFETIPIEQLELSLRAYNCLKRAQILTLADLAKKSYEDLMSLRNFGQKSAEEVRAVLATYNIDL